MHGIICKWQAQVRLAGLLPERCISDTAPRLISALVCWSSATHTCDCLLLCCLCVNVQEEANNRATSTSFQGPQPPLHHEVCNCSASTTPNCSSSSTRRRSHGLLHLLACATPPVQQALAAVDDTACSRAVGTVVGPAAARITHPTRAEQV